MLANLSLRGMRIQVNFQTILSLSCGIFLALGASAAEQTVKVLEASSTGKTLRINLGRNVGLNLNESVLITDAGQKVAAARVIRVSDDTAVIQVVDSYSAAQGLSVGNYSMIFGEPMDDVPQLPEYTADKNLAPENPANERFFTPDGRELENSPDLDDEHYSPEVALRPKFPESRTYAPNNITAGIGIFRNRSVANATSDGLGYATYQGYSFRYAYNFRTSYWLKEKTAAILSAEVGVGTYVFPSVIATGQTSEVRVVPLSFEMRYLIGLSKMFRIYPYLGYQTNIVGASSGIDASYLAPLSGGRLLGGIGGQLVLSEVLDARVEGGTDGVLFGLVLKF